MISPGIIPVTTRQLFMVVRTGHYFSQLHSVNPQHLRLATSFFHSLEWNRSFNTSPNFRAFENVKTKDLTLWKNLKEVKASPVPALTLGLSGLIPFVVPPAYMISSGVFLTNAAFAHVAYGACILSFLGGVRWGFTVPEENPVHPDWVNLGYSVTPSLIAWGGLLIPMPFSLLTVMAGLIFAAYCDMAMFGYPPWFKGLRLILSFVAVLSLWTTFMCSFMLDGKHEKKDPKKCAKGK